MQVSESGQYLESGEYVPIGHVRKFDLDFGETLISEKFESTMSCSSLSHQLN